MILSLEAFPLCIIEKAVRSIFKGEGRSLEFLE